MIPAILWALVTMANGQMGVTPGFTSLQTCAAHGGYCFQYSPQAIGSTLVVFGNGFHTIHVHGDGRDRSNAECLALGSELRGGVYWQCAPIVLPRDCAAVS